MELRQLRYFAEVARQGTYTAAAAALSVAQPALWRQVRDLESELGVPLFERVGRRVRLTLDGQALLAQAEDTLVTVERLAASASDLRSARAGIVAIACAGPHLQGFLTGVIGAYRRAHPRVAITIREYGGGSDPGRGIPEDLLGGLVDLATGVVPAGDERYDGFAIYRVQLVLAVPDAHPLRHAGSVDIATLRDQPLILSKAGAYSRRTLSGACRRSGFEPVIAFDSPSPSSIIALGAAGLGLPILASDAVAPSGDSPWPLLIEDGIPIGDPVSLGWRAGSSLSPAVRAFVDLARETVDQRQVSTSA